MNQATYDEYMNEQECFEFEEDLANGIYGKWVDKYPTHSMDIFASYIHFYGHSGLITECDVEYFKNKGVNLNISGNIYASDAGGSTPLGSASEFRMIKLMEILLKLGADVNLKDQYDFTPLDSAIFGHGANDIYYFDDMKECIELFLKYEVKHELIDYIKEAVLNCINDESKLNPTATLEYLINFISNCTTRELKEDNLKNNNI